MSAQYKALARANRLLAKRERQGDEAGDNPRRARHAEIPGPVPNSHSFRNPGRWTLRETQPDGRVRMEQGRMADTPVKVTTAEGMDVHDMREGSHRMSLPSLVSSCDYIVVRSQGVGLQWSR